MNTKKKTILITGIAVVLLGLWVLSSTLSKFKMIELDRVDIAVYVDGLSISDVYTIPESDFYFFIVWAGKRQEGYYIDFEKQVLSYAPDPKAKNIGSEKIKVREIIKLGYSTESNLVASFTKIDNEILVEANSMDVANNFKTRPLIFGEKLEFIFAE